MATDYGVGGLFEPLQIRDLRLANRFVMAPMTRNLSPGGVPGEDVAAYYARRARGGVGLIITEGVGVDHPAALGSSGGGESMIPRLYGEDALAGWRRVVEAVHAEGGTIAPQLWHQGVMREENTGYHPEAPSVRPSGLWGPTGRKTSLPPDYVARVSPAGRPMSDSEIGDVIAGFARSARSAKALGFDAVAIHGAHGYLIDTFLWPETNARRDRWGRQRNLFAAAVVEAIRREVGDGLPIIFRFSQWKQQDYAARLAETPAQLEALLGPIADAGADVFEGSVRYFNRPEFPGSPLNIAGWCRRLTGKLSMTVGGVGLSKGMDDLYDKSAGDIAPAMSDFGPLMARFDRGEFDLVGVGRSLLGSSDWVTMLKEGRPMPAYHESARLRLT